VRATTQATAGDAPSQRRGRRGVLGGCSSVPSNCCLHPTMPHLYCSSPTSCWPAFLSGYPAIAPSCHCPSGYPTFNSSYPTFSSLTIPPSGKVTLPSNQVTLLSPAHIILYQLLPKVTLPSAQVTLPLHSQCRSPLNSRLPCLPLKLPYLYTLNVLLP
jgi:hypothetical protein